MEDVTQTKSKWLIIVLIFIDEHYDTKNKKISSIEIEQGTWKKSIKDSQILPEDSISIVCATTRLTAFFQQSETKLETKFLIKDGNELKKFTTNNIGIKYKNRQYCATDFEENISKINKYYSGDNTIIITLGHGGFFGINSISKLQIDEETRKQEYAADITFENSDQNLKNNNINNYKSFFNDGSYFLSNAEISQSFLNVFKPSGAKKPVDILVMSNCFMQNIFTQFDLHKSVEYLVAPISGISFPGYNISALIIYLKSTPKIESVANFFTEKSTIESHRLYRDEYKKHINNSWFVQTFKLDSVFQNEFQTVFKNFIEELYNITLADKRSISLLKEVYKNCYKYSELSEETIDIIDFKIFIKGLKYKILINFTNLAKYQKLLGLTDELILLTKNQNFNCFMGENFLREPNTYLDSNIYFESLNNLSNYKNIGMGFIMPITKNKIRSLVENLESPLFQPQLIIGTKYVNLIKLLS